MAQPCERPKGQTMFQLRCPGRSLFLITVRNPANDETVTTSLQPPPTTTPTRHHQARRAERRQKREHEYEREHEPRALARARATDSTCLAACPRGVCSEALGGAGAGRLQGARRGIEDAEMRRGSVVAHPVLDGVTGVGDGDVPQRAVAGRGCRVQQQLEVDQVVDYHLEFLRVADVAPAAHGVELRGVAWRVAVRCVARSEKCA
jgi:hypothetical protein